LSALRFFGLLRARKSGGRATPAAAAVPGAGLRSGRVALRGRAARLPLRLAPFCFTLATGGTPGAAGRPAFPPVAGQRRRCRRPGASARRREAENSAAALTGNGGTAPACGPGLWNV